MVEALHHIKSIEASNTVAIAAAKTMAVLDFASLFFFLFFSSENYWVCFYFSSLRKKNTKNYTDKIMNYVNIRVNLEQKKFNCIRFKS